MESIAQDFIDQGFAMVPSAVAEAECRALEQAIAGLLEREGGAGGGSRPHGLRHVLARSPALHALVSRDPVRRLATSALQADAWPVKAIYFDKLPDANWVVPWHQDLAIAVRAKADCPGFVNWTTKDGVPHVQPPFEVLRSIATLRIHLDDTPPTNGALRVLPGSHRHGRLDPDRIAEMREENPEVVCAARRGDVLVMSPAILHASPKAEAPSHRRIVHVEYASQELPAPLRWRHPV